MNKYEVVIVDQFKEKQAVRLDAVDVKDAVRLVQPALNQGLKFGKLYDIISIEKLEV